MPCTKFMPMFNSEGLLEHQPNIVNSSKEMGNLEGSEENSEGAGIRICYLKGRLEEIQTVKWRELWRGKERSKD